MKKILFHIAFYTLIFQYANCYAASDSLPSCITDMKKTYPRISAKEYDYKGQAWFLIVKDTVTDKVIKNSDHQTHLKFYNRDCQLVGTWTKGGIAGLNKVSPDSIDKTKIIKVAELFLEKIPAVDCLPPCIATMKRNDSLVTSAEYDYKGQRWFIISKKISQPVENYPDKMTTTKFYNDNCQLVCTWTKGGIAGFNKVSPDSIDKTKISKVEDLKVPEKIMQLAIKNNATSITEYEYLGQTLYFLNMRNNFSTPKPMVVLEPYYDKEGRDVITFQRATSGAFLRAQGWKPHTVQPDKLIKKSIIW